MFRETVTPRKNWQHHLERLGFNYHSIDGGYWQETAAYRFNEREIHQIETASQTLHQMCMQTVADIIKKGDYSRLGISLFAAELIENSWKKNEPTLYGRFDLVYTDENTPPKLLEYNADTPTTLFESSVVQWYWLKDTFPTEDQFNLIHELLISQWKVINEQINLSHHSMQNLTFATITDSEEDTATCQYLQDAAIQAGLNGQLMDLRDLAWLDNDDEQTGYFLDNDMQQVDFLFKLYPWEWLLKESFAKYLSQSQTRWIEPAWKLLLSNKGLLAILWENYPNHPYLLPAYFEKDKAKLQHHSLTYGAVKKPIFSREGANIEFLDKHLQQTGIATTGEYAQDNGGWVYQAMQPLPTFHNEQYQSVYPVIGSWIIGHLSAGIGIREDKHLITKNTSHFVPHYFTA